MTTGRSLVALAIRCGRSLSVPLDRVCRPPVLQQRAERCEYTAQAVGAALPALKGTAVVLEAESDPAQGLQTSSMMAISALSPRRGTVRMMRV